MIRKDFTPPFLPKAVPTWRCPACPTGALALVPDSLRYEDTAESLRVLEGPEWEPEWLTQRFFALLRCTKCKEPVLSVGDVKVEDDYDEDAGGWAPVGALVPTFFEPAIPIIRVHEKCPEHIASEIAEASRLYWTSPSSAANRVRSALERLMDDKAIPKKTKTKAGTFRDLTLHARIERFGKKYPELSQHLLAIKWIGNSGSHSTEITADDMLDGFELLAYALDEIYGLKSLKLKKLSAAINKSKGPKKK